LSRLVCTLRWLVNLLAETFQEALSSDAYSVYYLECNESAASSTAYAHNLRARYERDVRTIARKHKRRKSWKVLRELLTAHALDLSSRDQCDIGVIARKLKVVLVGVGFYSA
jgi:hypothetical protein